jgi:cell wall-associated NlpC family hydrolase
MQSINYSDIDFNDGDIILFSATHSFISRIIQLCSWSMYSHIGMVIKDPTFTHSPLKGVYILESTFRNSPDAEDGINKSGVQITSLDNLKDTFNGNMYYRKLNCERNEKFYENLAEIHSKVHNLTYDTYIFDWIKVKFNIDIGNLTRTNKFWCSALTSYVYTQLGLLDSNTEWTLDTPKEWGTEDVKNSSVKFINCDLEKELKINRLL